MTCCHDARSARLHTFAIVTIRAYFVIRSSKLWGGCSRRACPTKKLLAPRARTTLSAAQRRGHPAQDRLRLSVPGRARSARRLHPGRDGLMDSFLTRVCTRDYNMSGEVLVAEAGPDCSHGHHQGRTVRRPSRPAIEREDPICMRIFASARSNASRTACITLPGGFRRRSGRERWWAVDPCAREIPGRSLDWSVVTTVFRRMGTTATKLAT